MNTIEIFPERQKHKELSPSSFTHNAKKKKNQARKNMASQSVIKKVDGPCEGCIANRDYLFLFDEVRNDGTLISPTHDIRLELLKTSLK